MDSREQFERRRREMVSPKVLFFKEILKRKFPIPSGMYRLFLNILTEYKYGRIDLDDMREQFAVLFSTFLVIIRGFCNSFPQPTSTKDDDVETPNSVKKVMIEEDSSKAIPVFGPISKASTSYASDYSQSPCSSGCYPLESEAVASCSSSSPSGPEAAEAYEAQKKEKAQLTGRILHVTEPRIKIMNEPQAYHHLTELVNIMEVISIDTYEIMHRASYILQGYPEMLESFNIFLPDGFRIVVVSDDHEMIDLTKRVAMVCL